MNLDELCNENSGKDTIQRVMLPWDNTHSSLIYWAQQMTHMSPGWGHLEDIPSVEKTIHDTETSFVYGLPTWEANKVCKLKYRNDVAKITLQIAVPESMQIKRDVRVTFADQIGVIGKMECEYTDGNLRA